MALIECKWQNHAVGIHTYQDMIKKRVYIKLSLPVTYVIFSKSGFHKSLNNIPDLKKIDFPSIF